MYDDAAILTPYRPADIACSYYHVEYFHLSVSEDDSVRRRGHWKHERK